MRVPIWLTLTRTELPTPVADALAQQCLVGAEDVVAGELAAVAEPGGQLAPAVEVVLGHRVLDGDDRVRVDERGQVVGVLGGGAADALARVVVDAVAEELRRGRVHDQADVRAGPVAGALDGRRRRSRVPPRRCAASGAKPPSSPTPVAVAGGEQVAAQGVEDLGAHADGLGEGVRPDGGDHELLEVQRVVGVGAAVDDVHHRQRQQAGVGSAEVAVQGLAVGRRGGLGGGEGDAEERVGAESGLGGRAVQRDQCGVEARLVRRRRGRVTAAAMLPLTWATARSNALAVPALGVAVAQLHGLPCAGGGAGRDGRAAERAVPEDDVGLDGGVAPAVDDPAGDDGLDGGAALPTARAEPWESSPLSYAVARLRQRWR